MVPLSHTSYLRRLCRDSSETPDVGGRDSLGWIYHYFYPVKKERQIIFLLRIPTDLRNVVGRRVRLHNLSLPLMTFSLIPQWFIDWIQESDV